MPTTATQYDQIAAQYETLKTTPGDAICVTTDYRVLGNIAGLHVLDLACGTGWYSRKLLEWGAGSVIGIDISAPMIEIANANLEQTPSLQGRLKYYVGDVTQPSVLQELSLANQNFDLVHGAWLLNYAATPEQLTSMFRTIASALKHQNSRFVGLIPNILDETFSFENYFDNEKYGAIIRPIEKVPHGYKQRMRTLTDPPVQFENYFLNEPGLYERCAREAGMEIVKLETVGPGQEDVERYGEGFFDDYVRRPGALVLVAVKASERHDI